MSSMYRALSLFSGIGGLCEGVKLSGYEIAGAAEIDKYAAESYRANFPNIPLYEGSVSDFLCIENKNYSAHSSQYLRGDVDLIFGGPPCQGFSQIGPRDPFDIRNELYLQICRIADLLHPKVILIENVPNMLLMKKGLFKERIIRSLSEIGYSNIGLLNLCADQYGVPQSRKHVFFLAVRNGFITESAQSILELVAETMKRDCVTVDDAISDLPEEVALDSGYTVEYPQIGSLSRVSNFMKEMRLDFSGNQYRKEDKRLIYSLHSDIVNLQNHHTKDVREKRLRIIKMLKPGNKADSLPKELWNNKRPEKWRRFNSCKPAHTLLAHMHRDLSEWIHPTFDRWITVREAMRLQGFHDGFVLKTSEWQQLKQVGNAVPPFLGQVPATAAKAVLDIGYRMKSTVSFESQMSLF